MGLSLIDQCLRTGVGDSLVFLAGPGPLVLCAEEQGDGSVSVVLGLEDAGADFVVVGGRPDESDLLVHDFRLGADGDEAVVLLIVVFEALAQQSIERVRAGALGESVTGDVCAGDGFPNLQDHRISAGDAGAGGLATLGGRGLGGGCG